MAKYRVKPTYSVEVKNSDTGKKEIEQRPYDEKKIEKYHGGKLLKVGDVIELTEEQLKIHGERFFELAKEAEPATEIQEEENPVTST